MNALICKVNASILCIHLLSKGCGLLLIIKRSDLKNKYINDNHKFCAGNMYFVRANLGFDKFRFKKGV